MSDPKKVPNKIKQMADLHKQKWKAALLVAMADWLAGWLADWLAA